MNQATIYLRNSLFSTSASQGHVPAGVMIIKGEILEAAGGGVITLTHQLCDERAKVLTEQALKLQLPWAKIDHIHHAQD